MPTSGEVRINGLVFINNKPAGTLKQRPPVIYQPGETGGAITPVPKPTGKQPNGRHPIRHGKATGQNRKKRHRGNAPVFHGVIRAPVTYVHQDAHMHCGRASLAMLRLKENPHTNIYDDPDGGLRELTPKAVHDLLPDYTTANPQGLTAKEEALREVGASINAGHPAMIKTNLYPSNEHIFILTGYDPNTEQFTATNTFVNSENGGSPQGMTMMAGVPLDVTHLAQHLKKQGSGPLIFVPTEKK